MEGLLRLGVAILAPMVVADRGGRLGPGMVAVMACALAAFVALSGAVICLVAALWNWSLPALGAVGTPLVCALALLLACAIFAVAVVVALQRRAPPSRPPLADLLQHIEGGRFVREHIPDILIGAVLLGLVAGAAAKPSTPGWRR